MVSSFGGSNVCWDATFSFYVDSVEQCIPNADAIMHVVSGLNSIRLRASCDVDVDCAVTVPFVSGCSAQILCSRYCLLSMFQLCVFITPQSD